MKPARFWPLMALMGASIVILVLNLLERDVYEHGSLTPPPPGSNVAGDDALLDRVLPHEFVHRCETCGDCSHPLEIVENRRLMSLRDHDGWYRLFWAADEVYHYDDPVFLAEGLQNPTSRDPEGSWLIRARIGPASHGAPAAHACSEVPGEMAWAWELVVSDHPIAPQAGIQALAYRCRADHRPPVLYLGWRPSGTLTHSSAPCPCGKP